MRFKLLIVSGPVEKTAFALPSPGKIVVGRSRAVDLPLHDDPQVSGRHFALAVEDDRVELHDLSNKNGTFLNGNRIDGARILEAGDIIRAGKTQFELIEEAERAEITMFSPAGNYHETARTCEPGTVQNSAGLHGSVADALAAFFSDESSPPEPSPSKSRGPQPPELPVIPGYFLDRALPDAGSFQRFQARSDATGERVLLSVMPYESMSSDDAKLFRRTMRETALLDHPGLARIVGHGLFNRSLYLAAEWIEGRPLSAALSEGPCPWSIAEPILLGALDALQYLHGLRRVHLEISPQTLWLADGGGAACRMTYGGLTALTHSFTRSHMNPRSECDALPFWSRAHFAPEDPQRAACDVAEIAAVFYTLLTGQFPREHLRIAVSQIHPQGNPALIRARYFQAHVSSRIVPIREHAPQIPPAVAQVLDAAIADSSLGSPPTYANAGEFLNALLSARAG